MVKLFYKRVTQLAMNKDKRGENVVNVTLISDAQRDGCVSPVSTLALSEGGKSQARIVNKNKEIQ